MHVTGAERETRALERVEAEFAPADRGEAAALVRAFLVEDLAGSAGLWDEVLEMAAGDLDDLRAAIRLARSDWRDLKVAAASLRELRSLLGLPGAPQQVLAGEWLERIRRDYARHRPIAERLFPEAQVDAVMLMMGPDWQEKAEEILRLARGDARRLRALLKARPAAEADPSVPAPLAHLPLAAAELIRRDFAPDAWDEAARAAGRVERSPGEYGVRAWLQMAEYAAGDLPALREAVRLAREDPEALARAAAARRTGGQPRG